MHAVLFKTLIPAGLALLACASASAQQVDCPDLQAVLATAEAEFAPIRGKLNVSIMPGAAVPRTAELPALLDFEEHVYETTRPLRGAWHCEIRVARMNDDAAALRRASYRCRWSSSEAFAALKRSLAACIVTPAAREEDPESLYLYVRQVASGEGNDTVFVSFETNAQGVELNVTRSVCLNRSLGGCDEE
jgi:hypothetical protein